MFDEIVRRDGQKNRQLHDSPMPVAARYINMSENPVGTASAVIRDARFPDMLMYRAATGIGESMQLTILLAIAANYFIKHRSAALGQSIFPSVSALSSARFWAACC